MLMIMLDGDWPVKVMYNLHHLFLRDVWNIEIANLAIKNCALLYVNTSVFIQFTDLKL